MSTAPRLFLNMNLAQENEFVLTEQPFHYLINVLRLSCGDVFLAFDNQNGEFECQITHVEKKKLNASILQKTREFEPSPDVWLLFAPVKKDKTDFIIEKATELGVRKIIPVLTQRTICSKTKTERFEAQAREACEQCRRVDVPQIEEEVQLSKILTNWDEKRLLFFMDESQNGNCVFDVFSENNGKPAALLVGPEGGFSPEEAKFIKSFSFTRSISLGKRILRAETAAAAALSCWQAFCGDWRK